MTHLGPGVTRRIEPTRIVFATAALFGTGDEFRFTVRLRGTSSMPLDLFCFGVVRTVTMEDTCFVVDSSIERTEIWPALDGRAPGE